jgi:hypothetical protein
MRSEHLPRKLVKAVPYLTHVSPPSDGAFAGPFKRSKFLIALFAFAAAYLPSSTAAPLFIGSYQPEFSYDANIFDQVQITSSVGDVLITPGAGLNDLNLQMSFGSKTVSLPLVVSGNVARLPQRGFDTGTAIAQELILLSDGNNVTLAYVEGEKTGSLPMPISFAVSHWQKNPTVGNPDAPIGSWVTTANANRLNLRGAGAITPFNLSSDQIPFSIGGDPLFATFDLPTAGGMIGPLTQNGSRLSLPNTPVTTPTSVLHAFDMLYDNAGFGSIFIVASELFDPTDVAVNIILVRAVPEAGTWTLFGIGLALVALAPRGRSRARH